MKNNKMFFLLLMFALLLIVCTSCQQNDPRTADNEGITFAVATDIHILANSLLTEETIDGYQSTDKMIHLSEPIFQTMADEWISDKYDYILLAGDLTERGDEESHQTVTSVLKRIEEAGIDVYVINGNHDVMSTSDRRNYSVSQRKFLELYSDFGFSEADSVLQGTLCYSLPIKNKFRLIAIDNISYYLSKDDALMTNEIDVLKIDWIDEMIDKANEEGLTPIFLSHKPFLNHWPKLKDVFIHDPILLDDSDLQTFAAKGVTIGFTGHSHLNDIAKKQFTDECSYYEVLTGSTCFCETNYRIVTFNGSKMHLETATMDKINRNYIADVISDEIKIAVSNNYSEYITSHFKEYGFSIIRKYLQKFINKFKTGNTQFDNLLQNEFIFKILDHPLYISDPEDNLSVEEIVSRYGIRLPKTNYRSLMDLLPTFLVALIKGNENLIDSDELTIIKYTFYSMIYILNEKADNIRSYFSSETEPINIDLEKLFDTGLLECYQSNLIPTLMTVIKDNTSDTKLKIAAAALINDFSSIDIVSELVASLTDGFIDDIDEYFTDTEINLEKLIEKGIFGSYIFDLILDKEPNDRTLDIQIK